MRAADAMIVVLLTLLSRGSLTGASHEPVVQRHVGVLPRSVCKQLIDFGEEAGFLIDYESIDGKEQSDPSQKYVPGQTLDVYDNGSCPEDDEEEVPIIGNEAIWNLLQPYIPKIKQIVKDNRNKDMFQTFYPNEPDREPELNWIFFRKYSPEDARNSLKHHFDKNMNTVNIELSDEYEGGGLFYIRPAAWRNYSTMGYEWIDTVKRENTSELVFPGLDAGDAIFYNYTVFHGIAPVEVGTRYSMAFFFEMDNPATRDVYEDKTEQEFEVELQNGLPGVELDVVQIFEEDGEQVLEEKFSNVAFNERMIYHAYEGDHLRVLYSDTREVVTDIEVSRGQHSRPLYKISQE